MRIARSVKILTFVTAVLAVLMWTAPGYSWTGRYDHGNGGYYSHGYHNGYRHYNRGYRNGYHRVNYYPYYRSHYYSPYISFGFPFVLPGFSFYVGP
jgi:hypothetical protein